MRPYLHGEGALIAGLLPKARIGSYCGANANATKSECIYIFGLVVSSTSGNSIKRRSSNLAKPKLYLVRTSNGYADLARPILECFIHGVGSTRLYAKGILIVSRRVCHDRYRSCLSLFTVVIINIINIIQSNIVYIIDTPYKLYHQPIHHY